MMKRLMLLLMLSLLMTQGCAEILYDELQAKQREDCYKRNDPSEVQECIKNTDMKYKK